MSASAEYVSVALEDLTNREQVEFDVFLQLGGKYVLYVRKGSAFDTAKVDKMKEKNVRNVFLRAEDGARFQQEAELLNARRIEQAYRPGSPLSIEERAKIVFNDQRFNADAMIADMKSADRYERAREGARRFTDFVLKEPGALRALLAVSNETTIASHGVRVAAYALSIAKETGSADANDLHLLALGCLVHDCGHAESVVPFASRLKDLSPDQAKVFKEHPERAARAAQSLPHFDPVVLKIIFEHEELIDGTGYPKGLNERQTQPFSVIASSANAFDKFVAFDRESYAGACKRLVVEKIGRHPLAHINALKKIAQEVA